MRLIIIRITLMRAALLTPLLIIALVVALLAGLPVASVGLNLFVGGTSSTWTHLSQTVLPDYIANTLWLCLGVGAGVGLIGVATASARNLWLATRRLLVPRHTHLARCRADVRLCALPVCLSVGAQRLS